MVEVVLPIGGADALRAKVIVLGTPGSPAPSPVPPANRLIGGAAEPRPVDRVECRERLGGLLRSYHRAA